jgi:solute carrier family 35 protein E1
VIVIAASVIFFKNPMSLQSKVCTGIALAGVLAYSQVKRIRKQVKKAATA